MLRPGCPAGGPATVGQPKTGFFNKRLGNRRTMNRGSTLLREKARKPKADEDVKIMEERLHLLKQQMLAEKQRRQELMQRNVGSIWKTGAIGPLRDKKAVEQSVQKVRLDGISRQSSGALDSENSRASTARKESPSCISYDGKDDPSIVTPCSPDRPRSAVSLVDNSVEVVSENSMLRPCSIMRPVTAASAEIQTDGGRGKKWEINLRSPTKRPHSAPRAPTYFEKVLEARRKFGELRVHVV